MPTKTQEWATPTSTSADPAGTITIGGGSNRVLVFVQGIEVNLDVSATTSVAIGNVAATGFNTVEWESGGSEDLKINVWYWNESDLSSMSGNSIDYSENTNVQKQSWSYATFSSADQTTPIVFAGASSASVSATPLSISTLGVSADYVAIIGVRDSANRPFESWGNLTAVHDERGFLLRFGVGDGAWAANSEGVAGDSFADSMLLHSLVIKATSGIGAGSLVAPVAEVSASGGPVANSLKPAAISVAGTGIRKVVWQGGVDLSAAKAQTAPSLSQSGGTGDLQPVLVDMLGEGAREVVSSSGMSTVIGVISGAGDHGFIGSGALSAPTPTMLSETGFDALWYSAKQVYF